MKITPVLREAERLHRLGVAVHWLRPRSKIPLESGWTTGPRKEWKDLEKSYAETLNVGVRLGTPSKINDHGYLAVVDVDVKSTEDRHRKEALAAAKKLLQGAACPVVLSGRGNGSRHYYCVTEKPFKTWNPFTSEEQVKVYMPSARISKAEASTLTSKEQAEGIRLRPAWDVAVYSEGRQVVLPPSIHPDSGKPYRWKTELAQVGDLPVIDFEKVGLKVLDSIDDIEKIKSDSPLKKMELSEDPELSDITWPKIEVAWLEISDRVKQGILTGEGVTDRSAFLLPACTALLSVGLSREEILSVLTDPETYLGQCAYDHARTTSRWRAAKWVLNYTLKKVIAERGANEAFLKSAKIEPMRELSDDEAKAQTQELGVEDDPEARGYYFIGDKGGLKPDYESLLKVFEKVLPFKTIAEMKCIFVFNGTHYVDFTPPEIKAFAEKRFNPRPEEKYRVEFLNKVMANHVVRQRFFTDSTEGKINFKNGVLDLSDGERLGGHSPKFGFRSVLPYGYDPDARCPVFRKWLHGVMLGDPELMAILQEFMGYIVRGGEYKYHKALWLEGAGRNGKSTFIDVLKALIGPDNYSTASIKSINTDNFAGADLDGKIANFSEETSPHELRESGHFKNLTGDGEIRAQKKWMQAYTFRNRAKLVMTYNQIPDLGDNSKGMLSRPIIIPFRKQIQEGEQDQGIKKKLFAELPGIFNFAFEGWKRLEEQKGFTTSALSAYAIKKVKEESCNVFQWVENYVDFDPLGEASEDARVYRPDELFTKYKGNERYAHKSSEFYRRLAAHPKMAERRDEKRHKVVYKFISVR